jgi:molybdopterin converting factor small subunit
METSQKPLTVLLFALAKEKLGRDFVMPELPLPTSVQALKEKLVADHPDLATLIVISRVAVNHSFAPDWQMIRGDEEVALIPPVSGG